MKSQTSKLRDEILKLEEPLDRLSVLKNKYEGETVYIISGGPSLNNYSMDYLREILSDKFVMTIKQSYEPFKEISDFHILNFTNFKPYDWSNNKSIVSWAIFEQFHPEMIFKNNLVCDLMIPIYRNNPQTGGGVGPDKMSFSVAERGDFELLKFWLVAYMINFIGIFKTDDVLIYMVGW